MPPEEREEKPGDARAVAPRMWLLNPDEFGRVPNPRWKTGKDKVEQARIGAAMHQHNVVRQLQNIISEMPRSKSPSNRALERLAGVDRDTISRMFNGYTHATVTVIACLADALGADLTINVEKGDE